MYIGIFGDSYADPRPGGWCSMLRDKGHDVKIFSDPGSSIVYSAQRIEYAQQIERPYDFIIWCFTIPGRFSIKRPNSFEVIHTSSLIEQVEKIYSNDIEALTLLQICKEYQTQVMNYSDEEFIGKCIADSMLNKYQNLMIIPCFDSPFQSGFSLFDISKGEMTISNGVDNRIGHMLPNNHERLAEIINNNLTPGLFTTSLDNFELPLRQI